MFFCFFEDLLWCNSVSRNTEQTTSILRTCRKKKKKKQTGVGGGIGLTCLGYSGWVYLIINCFHTNNHTLTVYSSKHRRCFDIHSGPKWLLFTTSCLQRKICAVSVRTSSEKLLILWGVVLLPCGPAMSTSWISGKCVW